MNFLVYFIAAIALVRGQRLDTGRRVFNNSLNAPSQPGQQRYAMKEIILYLTPSQIRALHEAQGLISPVQVSPTNTDQHSQTLAYHQNERYEPYQKEHLQPHVAPQPNQIPTGQESQMNPFVPIVPPPEYRQPEAAAYNTYQSKNLKRLLKPVPFFPSLNKEQRNNEPKAKLASRSQEPLPENDNDEQITRQQLKEQWLHILNQNIAHFKALDILSQKQRESNESKINFHYLSQNNQRHNDNNYAGDVYSLVRANNEHQLEKQQALLQAEAIANSPPVLVQKEINIKHTPHLIAHVPTPVLISIPDAFKVNIPRTYAVPLEMLRTLHLPILKVQTNEIDRAVPTEVEKHIPLSVAKNLYADRPYYVEHAVPGENQQPNRESTIIDSHVWHH